MSRIWRPLNADTSYESSTSNEEAMSSRSSSSNVDSVIQIDSSSSSNIVTIPILSCADCDFILVNNYERQQTTIDPVSGAEFHLVDFTQIHPSGVVLDKVICYTTYQGLVWLCRNCAYRLTMPNNHGIVLSHRDLQQCVFLLHHARIVDVYGN